MRPATAASWPRRLSARWDGRASGQPIAKMHGETLPPFALEELLRALQAMQAGDFSVRLPGSQTGILGKIADTFNDIVSTNQRMAQQLERVGEVVGKEGKTRQRVQAGLRPTAPGARWKPRSTP